MCSTLHVDEEARQEQNRSSATKKQCHLDEQMENKETTYHPQYS